MRDSLVLTFAELEFLLRSRPPELPAVREQLNLPESTDTVAAAGVASLLVRGLAGVNADGSAVPGEQAVTVAAGLSTADRMTRALGWVGEQMVLVHIASGPAVTVALSPGVLGQFTVQALDPALTVADQLVRFLGSCLGGAGESAVLMQSTTAAGTVSLAVAREETGTWQLSDSMVSPDRGVPSTRDAVVARIGELFSGAPAGVR